MPQRNDVLKRYLDAGMAFTQMTRSRAEAIVKDLVKAGEIQQKQAQKQVDDLMERSRKNTEQLLELIRKEIATQFSSLGIATKDDIARLEARINGGKQGRPASELVVATPAEAAAVAAAAAPGTAATAAPATKAPAKKATAKKAPAKKATAKKAAPANPS